MEMAHFHLSFVAFFDRVVGIGFLFFLAALLQGESLLKKFPPFLVPLFWRPVTFCFLVFDSCLPFSGTSRGCFLFESIFRPTIGRVFPCCFCAELACGRYRAVSYLFPSLFCEIPLLTLFVVSVVLPYPFPAVSVDLTPLSCTSFP